MLKSFIFGRFGKYQIAICTMAFSWNEIKDRALRFSKEWENTTNEEADAKCFLDVFFDVFGISLKKMEIFEKKVKKLSPS